MNLAWQFKNQIYTTLKLNRKGLLFICFNYYYYYYLLIWFNCSIYEYFFILFFEERKKKHLIIEYIRNIWLHLIPKPSYGNMWRWWNSIIIYIYMISAHLWIRPHIYIYIYYWLSDYTIHFPWFELRFDHYIIWRDFSRIL